MTKSKTKLITREREFSVSRAVVEKAMMEVFAEKGIILPEKHKPSKSSKTKG